MPFSGKILETKLFKDINKVWQQTIGMLKKDGIQKCTLFFNHPVQYNQARACLNSILLFIIYLLHSSLTYGIHSMH